MDDFDFKIMTSKRANPIQQGIKEPATDHELDRWHQAPNLQHDTSYFEWLPDLSVECLGFEGIPSSRFSIRVASSNKSGSLALVPAL